MIFNYCCRPQTTISSLDGANGQEHYRGERVPSPKVTNHQVVSRGLNRSLTTRTIEVIELICYSFSPNCMLVEADKRCNLIIQKTIHEPGNHTNTAYARPLQDLAEGRKYLDSSLKPESVGTLRLSLDRDNNQLEFRSISETNADELANNRTSSGMNHAERLSMSSFVLVERHDQSHLQAIGQESADNFEQLDSDDVRKSNVEFLSSLSIELIQDDEALNSNLENEPEQRQQQVEMAKRAKRSRRFNWRKLFGAGRDNSAGVAEDGDGRNRLAVEGVDSDGLLSDLNESYTYDVGNKLIGQLNLELGGDSIERQHQHQHHAATLNRPDSIYLWPEPLTRVYHHMDQSSAASSSSNNGANQQPISCLSGTTPPLVMISYNHKEAKSFAIELHAELDRLGVRAYLDLYDIRNGQDWQDSLNFAILDCRLFVPLITPSYGETLWTSREFKLADVLNKRIVPINFTRRWPPPSLAIQIATLQYFDWLFKLKQNCAANGDSLSCESSRWPRECVEAIAGQIRRILIEREAFVWPGNCQTSAASSAGSSGYGSRMSPELTSTTAPGVKRRDSPALIVARAPSRGARETDPMLASERVAHSHQSLASSTSSYGSLGGESPLASPASGVSHHGRSLGAAAAAAEPCRKRSFGQRTMKAFSKIKRSISGAGEPTNRKRHLLA